MLLSLVLHGALGLLLWRARPPSFESPAEAHEPLLLEFTEHEVPRAAPEAERPAVPPRETPRRPPQPPPARKPASAAAPAPALEPVASGPPSGPEAPATPRSPTCRERCGCFRVREDCRWSRGARTRPGATPGDPGRGRHPSSAWRRSASG
ncbi:hypothetical protein ACN28S_23750 [Cystobacter fuscus]